MIDLSKDIFSREDIYIRIHLLVTSLKLKVLARKEAGDEQVSNKLFAEKQKRVFVYYINCLNFLKSGLDSPRQFQRKQYQTLF